MKTQTNKHLCDQESRITRLEERQLHEADELEKLRTSIEKLNETMILLNTQFSNTQGKSSEQELVRGYIVGFIISLAIVFLTHVFRL